MHRWISIAGFVNRTSLWVATGAALLAAETMLLRKGQIQMSALWQVFFLTWCAYLFLRRNEGPRGQKLMMAIALLGVILTLSHTGFGAWPLLLLTGGIVLLYNLSVDQRNTVNLRTHALIKPASVGLAWMIIVVLLPLYKKGLHYTSSDIWLAVSVFFYITGLSICDDIRDRKADAGIITTLPLLIGLRASKFIINVHLWLGAGCWLLAMKPFSAVEAIIFILLTILTTRMVQQLHPARNKEWQAIYIDGCIVLRGLLMMLVLR
jgi:hypothetical protein